MLTQILHLVAIPSALMTIFAFVTAARAIGDDGGGATISLLIAFACLIATAGIYGLGQAIDFLGRTAHHSERTADVAEGLEAQLISLHSTLRIAVQQGGGSAASEPQSAPALDASTRAVLTKAVSHLENIDNQTEHGNQLLQWLGEKQESTVR